MFKNVPSIKGKTGSKSIVGRVVDFDGKETDENSDPANKSTSSKSTQKSISSSVSRIFGASPFKKTSTTRTPGRKLLKKLICTPGRSTSRSFPDVSISDIDDLGAFISKSNSTAPTLSRSLSGDEARDTFSIQASLSGQAPSSPPRLARTILGNKGNDMSRNINSNQMMQATRTASNHHISHKRVDEALVAASDRAGLNEDMIFLTNSSSDSDETDYRNEDESNQASRTKYSSPYSSPQQYERHSSPPKDGRFAMRSPGMSIPTPAVPRGASNDEFNSRFSGSKAPFPHPLRSFHDSPMEKMNTTTPNPKNLSSQFEEYEDDDAFLPDDFVNPNSKPKQDGEVFTLEQVEQKIREAQRAERLALRAEHEKAMDENQREFEKAMFESGAQWKKDADEQEARYQKLLKEERHKTSLKHHELINKAQSLADVKENMKEVEAERELLNRRIRDLESTEENMAASSKLEQALEVIAHLKGQLAALPSVDPEEIRTSKLEVENLKNLRAKDGKEIQALQTQLSQIVDEHQDALTPKKCNRSPTHSRCVGELDVLRVDYDKSQEQLKSMGKVLKRYRTERDDLKGTIDEIEERHISAIEIAIKLATQDLKDQIQLLKDENESLRQKPDIAEKMLEEMKNHMRDMESKHEEEGKELRGALDDLTKSTEEQQEAMRAGFETDSNELKREYEKKIETLIQEMDELRSNQVDELSLVRTNSKDEIDNVLSELRQLRANFEEEKTELIDQKTAECQALEDQIKSMNEMHSEELALAASESREEIEGLQKKVNQLESDLRVKSSETLTQGDFEHMKSMFEDDLKNAKAEKDQLLIKIKSLQEEKDGEANKSSQLDAQILEIKAECAAKVEKMKAEYDRQIHEVKSEHASESDDLLTQLDLIEAEAAQRFKNAEAAVAEKDAVITALGSQLAESESRVASTSKEYEALRKELESLRSDLAVVTASNENSQKEIASLIERHEKEIEDEIALREGACNEAREETIALAEEQLAERNEYYQALKRELDNARSKISVLERDMRFAKKEMEEMKKRHDAREADLRDELAQGKAAIATTEAKRNRMEKVHQAELERAREAEKAMKAKYEESKSTSHSIQKTLAKMVTEKQRLEQELSEVTAISEELATLCEKNRLM